MVDDETHFICQSLTVSNFYIRSKNTLTIEIIIRECLIFMPLCWGSFFRKRNMNKIAAKSEQFIDFTKVNSDKVLKFESNIAYFYGVEDRKLVAQHYIQAIKILETEGATSDKKVLRDKMLPDLEKAYEEVKKQTSLRFDPQKAAAHEFDLILAQSQRALFEDIYEIVVKLYKEMFQSENNGVQKAALLRTFLYQYKISLLSLHDHLSDADIQLLMNIAKRSEEELNRLM
jgi:hypothetical protein